MHRASKQKNKTLNVPSLMSEPLIICNCAHKHNTAQNITCKTTESRMSPLVRTLHFRGNFILCHKIALGRGHSYAKKKVLTVSQHTLCDAYCGVAMLELSLLVSTVWFLVYDVIQKSRNYAESHNFYFL